MTDKKTRKKINRERIEEIWNQDRWEDLADDILTAYDDLLWEHMARAGTPVNLPEVDHRIENFIRKRAKLTGDGTTYVGMTSSDLEDNIRMMRLENCYILLNELLGEFWAGFYGWFIQDEVVTQAYTHLLPAGVIERKMHFYVDYVSFINFPAPRLWYKGIHGSLGIDHVQDYIGLHPWPVQDRIIGAHRTIQKACTQTGDHLSELSMATWLSGQTAILARVANNVRQLFALGELTYAEEGLASTAIVNKQKPNPWRWERASGMAEQIYDLPGRICRVLSNCLLQRTLTNQSVLNHAFREATLILSDIIADMNKDRSRLQWTGKEPIPMTGEYEVVDLMKKKGLDRFTAYDQIKNHKKT